MRLIDADLLEPDADYDDGEYWAYSKRQIDDAPTIEERKTGRWIDGHCSECGCDIPAYIDDWKWVKDMDAKFCSQCGARMDGKDGEQHD